MYQTSVNVETEWDAVRMQRGVSWRYVVGKGIQYINEVEPKLAEITLQHDKVRRASNLLSLLYYLKEKHPQVYNEYIESGLANGAE